MTAAEISHRDTYLAARRARANVALRECNRTPAQRFQHVSSSQEVESRQQVGGASAAATYGAVH